MKNNFQVLLSPDDPASGGGAAGGSGSYTEDQLKAGIEKARLEERKKLSDQVAAAIQQAESLKAQIEALKQEKQALDQRLSDLTTAHEALKAGIKPDGGGTVDIEKAIQTAVNAALAKQGPALQSEIATLRSELEKEKKQREAAELAQLRIRIIEESGGATVLIPELVTGNNEEELKVAAERSKAILARSLEAAGSSIGGGTANNAGNSSQVIPLTHAASTGGGSVAGSQNQYQPLVPGGRMPLSEYATKRQQLKAAALARAKGA